MTLRNAVVLTMVGATVAEVCPISESLTGAYALKGDTCSRTKKCLNDGILMDDFQDHYTHERYGSEYGLYCSTDDGIGNGRCHEKKEHGYTCTTSDECQSSLCIDSVCLKEGTLASHQRCPENGKLWQTACGGMCWPNSMNLLSTQSSNWITTCSPLSEEHEGCSIIYELTDPTIPSTVTATTTITLTRPQGQVPTLNQRLRVKYDSCNPNGASDPRYHTESMLMCVPSAGTFVYPSRPSTVHDVTARGYCKTLLTIDDGADCSVLEPSTYRHNCKANSFCHPQTNVCTKLIKEGDRCSEHDTCKFKSACSYSSTETSTLGVATKYGTCTDLHSVDDGKLASSVQFCKFYDDLMTTHQLLLPRSQTYFGTCKSVSLNMCSSDAQCLVASATIPFPYYCDTIAQRCAPYVPDSCEQEWKDYSHWAIGKSYSENSLRSRRARDKSLAKHLVGCIHDETKSCLSTLNFLRVPTVPAVVLNQVSMPIPKMLLTPQFLVCDDGTQGADFCSTETMSTGMLIVILSVAGCAVCVCLMILCGEYRCCQKAGMSQCCQQACGPGCWAPAEKPEKKKKELSDTSSESHKNEEIKMNPIPMFAAGKDYESPPPREIIQKEHTFTPNGTPEHKPTSVTGVYPNGSPVTIWYEGNNDGYHGWFNANVTGYNPIENTYEVRYETNEVSDGVSPGSVRLRVCIVFFNSMGATGVWEGRNQTILRSVFFSFVLFDSLKVSLCFAFEFIRSTSSIDCIAI